jgi:sugar O-acyltransferase (sialic acid O-acetyltransferase NeuD family)
LDSSILLLPTLGVNDEFALLRWQAPALAAVRRGQLVAEAETTKATFEIHAEAAGYIYPLVADGENAKTGQPIAVIHAQSTLSEIEVQALLPAAAQPEWDAGRKKWTKKAELLASSRGISIESVPFAGEEIREADVHAFLDRLGARQAQPSGKTVSDTVDDVYSHGRRQRVLVLGGGRGAVQLLDVILRTSTMRAVGILDDSADLVAKSVLGVPVLGLIGDVARLWDSGSFDALVMAMSNAREYRRRVFEDFRGRGIPFANVIDPLVSIHSNVRLGQGNLIMAHCRIGSCAIVGDNNFLSASVNLEHHNRLGDHCTFGPAVSTSSRVTIGNFVKFGTGIFIEPGVSIGDNCIIASGAVLTGPIPANSIVKVSSNITVRPIGS